MPVNVYAGTTAPDAVAQVNGPSANLLPLFAYQVPQKDYLVGGFTIASSTVPLVSGKRIAYAGDIFVRNDTTKLWDYAAANDTGAGTYVMLTHDRDCTAGNQSGSGVLRSDHVNKGVLKRDIPAALVGAKGPFQYHIASPVETWG